MSVIEERVSTCDGDIQGQLCKGLPKDTLSQPEQSGEGQLPDKGAGEALRQQKIMSKGVGGTGSGGFMLETKVIWYCWSVKCKV